MNSRPIWLTVMALAAITCLGCQHVYPTTVSDPQQAAIRSEISQVAENFIAALEQVDASSAMSFLAEVPEFRHPDNEGHLFDYAGTKRAMSGFYAVASSQRITTKRHAILVLDPDAALYVWQGSVSVNLKSGAQLSAADFNVSALFKRIDGRWKILF